MLYRARCKLLCDFIDQCTSIHFNSSIYSWLFSRTNYVFFYICIHSYVSNYLIFYLFINLFIYLYFYIYTDSFIYLFTFLFIYLFNYFSIYTFIYLRFYLLIYIHFQSIYSLIYSPTLLYTISLANEKVRVIMCGELDPWRLAPQISLEPRPARLMKAGAAPRQYSPEVLGLRGFTGRVLGFVPSGARGFRAGF